MSKSLTIIIPSYNEAANLPLLIPNLMQAAKVRQWKVIFVNDGSKDVSQKILEDFQQQYDYQIVHNKVNKGYGGAIKEGIRHATTELVITIDADGQHSVEDVQKLYEYLLENGADMVVGKRPDSSSGTYRRFGKNIIRTIAKILLPIHIHDINSGMKMYDTKLAKKIFGFVSRFNGLQRHYSFGVYQLSSFGIRASHFYSTANCWRKHHFNSHCFSNPYGNIEHYDVVQSIENIFAYCSSGCFYWFFVGLADFAAR